MKMRMKRVSGCFPSAERRWMVGSGGGVEAKWTYETAERRRQLIGSLGSNIWLVNDWLLRRSLQCASRRFTKLHYI